MELENIDPLGPSNPFIGKPLDVILAGVESPDLPASSWVSSPLLCGAALEVAKEDAYDLLLDGRWRPRTEEEADLFLAEPHKMRAAEVVRLLDRYGRYLSVDYLRSRFAEEKRVSIIRELVNFHLPFEDFVGLARRTGWADQMVSLLWRYLPKIPLGDLTVDDVAAAPAPKRALMASLLGDCPPDVALSAIDSFEAHAASADNFVPSVPQMLAYGVLLGDPDVQRRLVERGQPLGFVGFFHVVSHNAVELSFDPGTGEGVFDQLAQLTIEQTDFSSLAPWQVATVFYSGVTSPGLTEDTVELLREQVAGLPLDVKPDFRSGREEFKRAFRRLLADPLVFAASASDEEVVMAADELSYKTEKTSPFGKGRYSQVRAIFQAPHLHRADEAIRPRFETLCAADEGALPDRLVKLGVMRHGLFPAAQVLDEARSFGPHLMPQLEAMYVELTGPTEPVPRFRMPVYPPSPHASDTHFWAAAAVFGLDDPAPWRRLLALEGVGFADALAILA